MTSPGRGAYVRMLGAVYAAMFLIRLAFGIVIVTFAVYLKEEGDFVYSLVVTASPLLEMITVPFAGVLGDRYGRKGALLAGLGLGAVSLYSLALTKNVALLGVINAFHGIAAALIIVTTLAIIASIAPPEHRGRDMGWFNLANIAGWVLGFAVGGLMLDAFEGQLEYTFVVAGGLATLGLLFANRSVQLPVDKVEKYLHGPPTLRDLWKAVTNRRILLLVAPWLIVFLLLGPFITFFPRVAEDALDVSGVATALGILVVGVIFLGSQVFWGRLADRYGRDVIMLVGAVGFALLMGVIVYAYLATGSRDAQVVFENVVSHWGLLALFLFTALAFAPAGLAALADEARAGAQGTTMSLYSLTLSLGFIVGPTVVGAISDSLGGVGMMTYFAALAGLLLALVVTRYLQTESERRRAASAQESWRG